MNTLATWSELAHCISSFCMTIKPKQIVNPTINEAAKV